MKKIVLFLFIGLSFVHIAHAQKVNYTIIDNDADNYKRTGFTINPWQFDLDYANSSPGGFGVRFETQVNFLMPWVNYYMDYFLPLDDEANLGIQGVKRGLIIEVGTELIFKRNYREKELPVAIKSIEKKYGSFTETSTWTLNVPVRTMTIYSLKGGLSINRSLLNFDIKESVTDPWDKIYEQKRYLFENSNGMICRDLQPITQTYTKTFFLGLNIRTVKNVIIDIIGIGANNEITIIGNSVVDGIRKRIAFVDYYCDVMYAPVIKIDNILDNDGEEWKIVSSDEAKPLQWGFRIGVMSRIRGMSINSELGLKPGPSISDISYSPHGLYLVLGMGFYIGTKKGLLLPK
jgi:hypothetical protein